MAWSEAKKSQPPLVPSQRRPHIRKSLHRDVEREHGSVCHLCGGEIDRAPDAPWRLKWSLDHLIPFSQGGEDSLQNLRPAHLGCNVRRGTRDIDEQRSGAISSLLSVHQFRKVVANRQWVKLGEQYYRPVIRNYSSSEYFKAGFGRATDISIRVLFALLVVAGLILLFRFALPIFFLVLGIAFLATRPPKNRYGKRGKRKWGENSKQRPKIHYRGRRQYLVRCLRGWEESIEIPSTFVNLRSKS